MEVIHENNLKGDIEINSQVLGLVKNSYEELLIGDEVQSTMHKQILRGKRRFLTKEDLLEILYRFN